MTASRKAGTGSVAAYAGGVTGANDYRGHVFNCENRGPVKVSNDNADLDAFSGGIVGASVETHMPQQYSIAYCVNYGPVTGVASPKLYTGSIVAVQASGAIYSCFWNADVAGMPAQAGAYFPSSFPPVQCMPFSGADGSLASAFTESGKTFGDLFSAARYWATLSIPVPPVAGMPLLNWSRIGSDDGQPHLTRSTTQVVEAGGVSAGHADIPAIVLPQGGECDVTNGRVYERTGALVYARGQDGVRITDIGMGADDVGLTFEACPVLFGKADLTDTAWTYLGRPGELTASVARLAGFRFFTARAADVTP